MLCISPRPEQPPVDLDADASLWNHLSLLRRLVHGPEGRGLEGVRRRRLVGQAGVTVLRLAHTLLQDLSHKKAPHPWQSKELIQAALSLYAVLLELQKVNTHASNLSSRLQPRASGCQLIRFSCYARQDGTGLSTPNASLLASVQALVVSLVGLWLPGGPWEDHPTLVLVPLADHTVSGPDAHASGLALLGQVLPPPLPVADGEDKVPNGPPSEVEERIAEASQAERTKRGAFEEVLLAYPDGGDHGSTRPLDKIVEVTLAMSASSLPKYR